ncbi:hypothetical protein [Flavobacterium pedocola]
MNRLKKNIVFLFFLGIYFTNTVLAQNTPQKNTYPKTCQEAVAEVIKIMHEKDKHLFRDCPKFEVRKFAHIIHDSHLINYSDSDLLTSCAKSIGTKYVHPEDVTNVILAGVWDKLNSDLELVDFEKVVPEHYFNAISTVIEKGKGNRSGYLASLPYWVYHANYYQYSIDSIRDNKLLNIAKKMVLKKNQTSYLGLLYLSQFGSDLDENTRLIQPYYLNTTDYFTFPSYEYTYNQKSLLKKSDELIGVNYVFKKTSYKDFALKCYEIIYNKTFTTSNDYEAFLKYCNTNYLAKWKFLKTLSLEDYESLLNEPRKLLEILTLTNKYYFRESSTHNLIMSSDSVDDLINIIESKNPISLKYPYHKKLEEYNYLETNVSYKPINALKMIAERLTMEELFAIMDPKSIEFYNNTYKTDDTSDYKYLISFLIASQYERLLKHPDKERVFKTCYYYWENEHVSWPFKYFLTDLLIQIDNKKALSIFKEDFKTKPTDGSFTRQAILSSIIEYDFQNNSKFIEDWYWVIHDTRFNYDPAEQDQILKLLKEKDSATLNLYNKITNDVRFKK